MITSLKIYVLNIHIHRIFEKEIKLSKKEFLMIYSTQ